MLEQKSVGDGTLDSVAQWEIEYKALVTIILFAGVKRFVIDSRKKMEIATFLSRDSSGNKCNLD